MKTLVILLCLALTGCAAGHSKEYPPVAQVNLLDSAPYNDDGMGKRKLVDHDELLMMQAALKPGQAVPQHSANSNVHIVVLDGEIVINLDGKDVVARKHDLVPVAFKTPMNIKNTSSANATFIIIKTPNPSQMR